MNNEQTYQIARSNRRTVSLQIQPDGTVLVKAPYLVPKFIIDRFVQEKREWIRKHQKVITTYPKKTGGKIQEGDKFPFLGEYYPIHIGPYTQITRTKTINIPQAVMFRIKKELTAWYVKEAKQFITERVKYYAEVTKTQYKNVSFSDTSSKWGSCSHDNALQFSWRLIMAPLLIIDYVVVHELMHTKEKNHGARFWSLVATYKPAHKQHRKWLRSHSHELHAVL